MYGEVYPYIVPVSFGTEVVENKIVIYFYCAQKRTKIELLKENPLVGVFSCVDGLRPVIMLIEAIHTDEDERNDGRN